MARALFASDDLPLAGMDRAEIDIVMEVAGLYLGTESRFVDQFEADLARYFACPSAVVTNSDSGAVSTLIGAMGLIPGDEIILSPCVPNWLVFAISHAGLVPVFADLFRNPCQIEHQAVLAKVTEKSKGVVIAPLWGYPVDLGALAAALKQAGLPLIVDVSQSMGASISGRNLLAQADIGLLSLRDDQPTVKTGEGGAILLRDADLAAKAKSYARFSDLDGIHLGINQKLSEMQAALGSTRLRTFDARLERQREAADVLDASLRAAGIEPLLVDGVRNGTCVVVRADGGLAGSGYAATPMALAIDVPLYAAAKETCPNIRTAQREWQAIACHVAGGV